MTRDEIIDRIIDTEGGYVDDPNDPGGETNYGITSKVAARSGYKGPMRDMPRSVAADIYRAKYWDKVRADDLFAISPELAAEVVDTGVNMGPGTATKFLQTSLSAFGYDIAIDGGMGPKTLAALQLFAALRDVNVLTRAVDCLQGAKYIEIALKRDKSKTFVYGWMKNRTGAHL